MTIEKTRSGNTVTLSLEGWLDYDAAPELKKAMDELEKRRNGQVYRNAV